MAARRVPAVRLHPDTGPVNRSAVTGVVATPAGDYSMTETSSISLSTTIPVPGQ